MEKRIFKLLIILLLGLILGFFSLYVVQTKLLKQSLENKWLTAEEISFNDYELIRCNWNILRPTVVFVDDYVLLDDIKGLEMHFYTQQNLFDFTRESWSEVNWTGGADIKNLTFPELVTMVKKDCSQFQYGYDNPDPNGPRWTYTAASEDGPIEYHEPTEEEIRVRDAIQSFKFLNEAQQQKVIERYGPMDRLNAEELIEWDTQIREDIESGDFSLD